MKAWDEPIELEILSFVRNMKSSWLLQSHTTIWGRRAKRESEIYANAYATVEKHILREMDLRKVIKESKDDSAT